MTWKTGLRCPYGCQKRGGQPVEVRGFEESVFGQVSECERGHIFLTIQTRGTGFVASTTEVRKDHTQCDHPTQCVHAEVEKGRAS